MLFVRRIGDDTKVVVVAMHATGILGRAGMSALDTDGVRQTRRGGLHLFENKGMKPGIAEVVLVLECVAGLSHEPADGDGGLVLKLVVVGVLGTEGTVALGGGTELVQVVVLPAHDGLQNGVKTRQARARREENPTPNRWVRFKQRNVDLQDLLHDLDCGTGR